MRRRLLAAPTGTLTRLPAGMAVGLLLLPPLADPAAANDTKSGIEIIDYGIYSLNITRRVAAPGDVSRERNIVANVRVIRKERTILAQPERSFGYQFRITDPALARKRIVLRTIFPKLTNPTTGASASSQKRVISVRLNAPIYDGYRFDYKWEMAEGIWRFQIVIDGKVVSEQRFKVVVPLN
jgi:hypothetical protein